MVFAGDGQQPGLLGRALKVCDPGFIELDDEQVERHVEPRLLLDFPEFLDDVGLARDPECQLQDQCPAGQALDCLNLLIISQPYYEPGLCVHHEPGALGLHVPAGQQLGVCWVRA